MLTIGPYQLASPVFLAPMAGVTDRPFRQLCRRFGVGLAVSEMVTSDARLWNSRKSQLRLDHQGEPGPRSVQIAGGDPEMMAHAAQLNVERGAQIIDINMGCPAKKVCKKAAGSALMKDEKLVSDILQAVVTAVDVPVTLKIRTGWSPDMKNGVTIARIAEDHGIQALAVHGRTRACGYTGIAEYDTIATIKAAVGIPVIANGDIDSPAKAKAVLDHTAADGVMIGRAAQGSPWICQQIDQYLREGIIVAAPSHREVRAILLEHLDALYAFYGEFMGVKIARKHVGWYLKEHNNCDGFRRDFNRLETTQDQCRAISEYFESLPTPPPNAEEIAA
jgi:tRNA-dihydrouridine synthase B